jgi:hypothetical protein
MTYEIECDRKEAPDAGNVQGQYKSGVGGGEQVKDSRRRRPRQAENAVEVFTGVITAPGTTAHGKRGAIFVRSLGELGIMLSFAILDDGEEWS